jgi:ABC-2 type transport system permease protein
MVNASAGATTVTHQNTSLLGDPLFVLIRRELGAYFANALAYVFLIIFLSLAGTFTFTLGSFFERGLADLQPFFQFHPWLYLLLMPALTMRLWAEERKLGTHELLLTMPIDLTTAVVGKFFAAWLFAGLALLLTFPLWVVVNYLGYPDNGVILVSYLASWLLAGTMLALGSAMSALTKNQVIAFILGVALCFVLIASGSPIVLGFLQSWAPAWLLNAMASLSLMEHYDRTTQGVIGLDTLLYFGLLIYLFLQATIVIVHLKKTA